MDMQTHIEETLTSGLSPTFLHIENESHMHSGPATESHFKVTIVSDKFEGQMLIKRHRAVNELLKDALANNIHALTIHAMTPNEYFEKAGAVPDSPECAGGSK